MPAVVLLTPLLPQAVFQRRDDEEPDEASEREIEAFIAVGTREGILEPEEGEMVRGVMDFGDTRVRSIMTPRIDMVCAAGDLSLDELADLFVESSHSRVPIYEGNIDNIVGILNLRDLVRALRSDSSPRVQRLMKPVVAVPETTPLSEVLQRLQRHRQQIALVVDEYGGTSGLVTVEDLLEEIVGEIVDEDDELPPAREPLAGGGWRFDGRMRVEELEELFDLELDDEPYDTVGGMIFSAFGHVPDEGEEIEVQGLRIVVEKVEDRRIQTIQVAALASSEDGEADQEAEAAADEEELHSLLQRNLSGGGEEDEGAEPRGEARGA